MQHPLTSIVMPMTTMKGLIKFHWQPKEQRQSVVPVVLQALHQRKGIALISILWPTRRRPVMTDDNDNDDKSNPSSKKNIALMVRRPTKRSFRTTRGFHRELRRARMRAEPSAVSANALDYRITNDLWLVVAVELCFFNNNTRWFICCQVASWPGPVALLLIRKLTRTEMRNYPVGDSPLSRREEVLRRASRKGNITTPTTS